MVCRLAWCRVAWHRLAWCRVAWHRLAWCSVAWRTDTSLLLYCQIRFNLISTKPLLYCFCRSSAISVDALCKGNSLHHFFSLWKHQYIIECFITRHKKLNAEYMLKYVYIVLYLLKQVGLVYCVFPNRRTPLLQNPL